MGIDYYNVLKVSRTISDENLKRAYKRLAMRWHPDKNPANKQEAEAKFKQISEAYDVLGDPHKRRIYDLYGEEVLRVGGDAFYSGTDSRNAEDIFSQCFDESEPSEQAGLNSNGFNNQSRVRSPVKAPPVEHKLLCSLEELYMGCKKKMKITRIIYSNGKEETLEETLTITVKPGWKRGTKVTFPEKGNQLPDMIPADVVFVIDEKPHPIFRRNGDDLLVKQRISLIEALTGKILCLKQLDGRVVTIPLTNVINPGHELLVRGEGMPIAKERGSKGNLRMKFSVEFPTSLTEEQISGLRRIFKYQ